MKEEFKKCECCGLVGCEKHNELKEEFNLGKKQKELFDKIIATIEHKLVKIDLSWLIRRLVEYETNDKEFIRLLKEEFKNLDYVTIRIDKLAGEKLC